MKYKFIKYLFLIGLLFFLIDKSHAQSAETEAKLQEVFFEIAASMSNEEKLNWESYLNRCMVVSMSSLPEGVDIKNLSDLPLVHKYGGTYTHDLTYEESTFNPLKYLILFHLNYDQYFRFGSTDYVLKVVK